MHAHVHGDVNTAYRVRDHEWQQVAKGDPQWPQAFYPVSSPSSLIDVKDGDALVGVCTYHNDENRNVYAGSTHNDEMCNIYLMYYADSTDGVMDVCAGSSYPQLETIIPDEAYVKPTNANGTFNNLFLLIFYFFLFGTNTNLGYFYNFLSFYTCHKDIRLIGLI